MPHCGRRKQNGAREPNGRLRRGEWRDPATAEKEQVLAQPHRRGEIDQRIENPLGRLTLKHKLDRAYYDAGLTYGSTVRHYYVAHGVQIGFSEGRGGSGLGVRPGMAKRGLA